MVRYGFNKPTEWAYSISLFLTGAFFILGGGYALLYKSHVNMDVVYNRFPLKTRAIVDLFTSTLFFLFCGVLFWKSLGYVWNSLTILETTDYPPYFPIYPVKLTIPIAAFLILLQGLAKFIRDFMIAITGRVA
jgi:TRAP-type mannitol/chloroaromatic compound transport system permease small subunit